MPALNRLATRAFDDEHTYGDMVYFVHMYVTDPHPSLPDLSPYSARKSEIDISCPQPRTYDERVALARVMADSLIGPQRMLVDDLGGNQDNAVWCTYGPAPNLAYLIDRSGTIRTAQLWADADALRKAIDDLFGR